MSAALALREPAPRAGSAIVLLAHRIHGTGASRGGCLTIPFPGDRVSGMNLKSTARRLRFGDCLLDEGRGLLIAPAGETVLRPKTFDLLRLLLDNPGRVIARNEILDAVWPNLFVTDDSITQCVVEIRKAIGPRGAEVLKTLPRRGYMLEAEVVAEGAPATAAAPMLTPRQDDRPSIAVLPFRMAGSQTDSSYFEDGIIEGIVHVLSGLDGLFVVSRGSALAFAQKSLDPRAAGRELGVRYVLYGGVRRAGGRLRITTELSETERGTILRNDRYDGEADDLFEVQDRIAERVATTILPQVKAEELARAMRKPPDNLTAYDLVLRALHEMQKMDRDGMLAARDLLHQAVAADPDHALPHSQLAWWHLFWFVQGWSEDFAAETKAATEAAAIAIARDPQDGMALAVRGLIKGFAERDIPGALELLERAVRATPSCAIAWSGRACVRCWLGENTESVAWAERAVRLAPQDPFTFLHEQLLAYAHHAAGDPVQAEHWARKSLAANPRHAPTWRILVVSLVAQGREAEAADCRDGFMAADPGFTLSRFAAATPLQGAFRDRFVECLARAGLPA
jgi:adenylate cyclase